MEKSENPLMQSLNGQWEFACSKNVMDRPENFYEENFDASSFAKIMVPRHLVGSYILVRRLMIVVFPEPLRPIIAVLLDFANNISIFFKMHLSLSLIHIC